MCLQTPQGVPVVRAVEWFGDGSNFNLNSEVLKCFEKEKLNKFNFLTQVNLFLEVTIEESLWLYPMFYAYNFHIT